MQHWKPQIIWWLDDTEHFFNHVFAEFAGEAAFAPLRLELDDIRALDVPLSVRNRFLFHHLRASARELERSALITAAAADSAPTRPLVSAAGPASESLAGPWTAHYRQGPGAWVDRLVELPTNWELLPGIDNYAGTMRFTRVVMVDDLPAERRLVLRFHGVDYFADLWVNGHYVGGHEGYFAPFEFDVSAFVRPGDANILRLAVTSPNDPTCGGVHVTSGWDAFSPEAAFPNRKTLIKGTLGHHDARRGGAWSCLTSQDGNTGGVWNEVELKLGNPLRFTLPGPRVTTLSTTATTTPGEHEVRLHCALAVANPGGRPIPGRMRILVEPANFDGPALELSSEVVVGADGDDLVLEPELGPVRLWHPRDHGFPYLYRMTFTLEADGAVQDVATIETGFRILAVSPIGESQGVNGAFMVNGRPVFVRGTNLLPTYWLSEYTPDRVARDFAYLTEAGFNALLVHNVVPPKHFFTQANRLGFLVVQMFPLQWSYEQSSDLEARATAQIRDMAGLLMNDPSVVSYEVHNEPDMRTAPDLDNRLMDFGLHLALRAADPSRWVTTFSSGNHAYPGQFYPLRDDNGFATLPARFLEEEVHGRRIARHRNMPTEFGIQALPHTELFTELVSESRVTQVLARIRTDPKWLATGAEGLEEAERIMQEAKDVLGDGTWAGALDALDWSLLADLGSLVERIGRLERAQPEPSAANRRERLSCRVALLLLDVLHYGGFKGENFWFGLWRPAPTLEEFVASSQDRQYRLHKDAVETYLNAGVVGPIVGYFSFMFRDADWQAPTWGVIDAAWVPKRAYRAYLESNHPVRVSLPHALRTPVKFPGDPWFTARGDEWEPRSDPWVAADVVVGNDTDAPLGPVRVTVRLEDGSGAPVPSFESDLEVVVEGDGGWSGAWPEAAYVPDDLRPGTYYLSVTVEASGGRGSTNGYEFLVLDTMFDGLSWMTKPAVKGLLEGSPGHAGFHYWQHGAIAHRARPGLRGLLNGFRDAHRAGIDLYEVVQGEHLFRHVLDELSHLDGSQRVRDDIWRIRSEIVSPREKARALLRYLERFVARAEQRLASTHRARRLPSSPAHRPKPASIPSRPGVKAVGRDITPNPRMKEEDS